MVPVNGERSLLPLLPDWATEVLAHNPSHQNKGPDLPVEGYGTQLPDLDHGTGLGLIAGSQAAPQLKYLLYEVLNKISCLTKTLDR